MTDAVNPGADPRGGTFVTGDQQAIVLAAGETWMAELADAYCAALVHVNSVK